MRWNGRTQQPSARAGAATSHHTLAQSFLVCLQVAAVEPGSASGPGTSTYAAARRRASTADSTSELLLQPGQYRAHRRSGGADARSDVVLWALWRGISRLVASIGRLSVSTITKVCGAASMREHGASLENPLLHPLLIHMFAAFHVLVRLTSRLHPCVNVQRSTCL